MTDFLFDVIATELEDAVGRENCSTRTIDKLTHSVDYFWLSRMWADRGLRMPEGDFIVAPKDAKEVSAVLKIANYYKIPVTTWGAGGGTQGGAIPVCGGIVLDTKRMNRIWINVNKVDSKKRKNYTDISNASFWLGVRPLLCE